MTTARMSARRLRTRSRPFTVALVSFLTLALAAGGYTWAVAATELPALHAELSVQPVATFTTTDESAQAAVDTQAEPTAIGWTDNNSVWSNDDATYPIASLVKVVTVLVGLGEQPLEAGADGPSYVWSTQDRQRQNEILAMLGVAQPVPVGTELTMRQMLQLAMLPSSNDFAEAYAYWVFGDNETFLAAVDRFKAEHGLDSLTIVEPTGLDARNQATAADMVRLARIALQHPTLVELSSTESVELPWGVGLIENTNPLLGTVPGVIGVKTGALGGYNLMLAQEAEVLGRPVINISVTLQRPTKLARAESGQVMLAAMAELPQLHAVAVEGQQVGTVTTWEGTTVQLVTQASVDTVLLPAELATRTIDIGGVKAVESGQQVGQIVVDSPAGDGEVAIVTATAIEEPGLWWRLTHPGIVFG